MIYRPGYANIVALHSLRRAVASWVIVHVLTHVQSVPVPHGPFSVQQWPCVLPVECLREKNLLPLRVGKSEVWGYFGFLQHKDNQITD